MQIVQSNGTLLFFFKGVILGGQEKTAQNVYHFLVVTGKTDIVTNQWNVNAKLVITETSVSMPIVPPDVIHNMAIAYAQTHAGVTQVRYNYAHKSLTMFIKIKLIKIKAI